MIKDWLRSLVKNSVIKNVELLVRANVQSELVFIPLVKCLFLSMEGNRLGLLFSWASV
jgi:hypothetical protein